MTARTIPLWSVVPALLITLAVAQPVSSQDFRGRVIDASTGQPISGVRVEVLGVSRVTVTGADGRFTMERLSSGTDSIRVSRYGYATLDAPVSLPLEEPVEIPLSPDPITLEGIGAVATFEESFAALEGLLDSRLARWPGRVTVADQVDLRPWDDEWEGDPYAFLHNGPLKVTWRYTKSGSGMGFWIKGWRGGAEIYIDERRWWNDILLEMPNESICRMEMYIPSEPALFRRVKREPPAQIRAYSCAFMARVAAGIEEICPNIQWGGLISGPEEEGDGAPALRAEDNGRGDVRPTGSLTPISLGAGLDLGPNTIGVGSAACTGGGR